MSVRRKRYKTGAGAAAARNSKRNNTEIARILGIPKLADANNAGNPSKAKDCTLILTEGDTAKSLAMAGLMVLGTDYYGVYPLRGKLLKVRDAKQTQILKNNEVQNIIKVMGLKYNETYDENNIHYLRYGHFMIMADQDHDGNPIKGLVINLIHRFWPSLLIVKGFLQMFITPIVIIKLEQSLLVVVIIVILIMIIHFKCLMMVI